MRYLLNINEQIKYDDEVGYWIGMVDTKDFKKFDAYYQELLDLGMPEQYKEYAELEWKNRKNKKWDPWTNS